MNNEPDPPGNGELEPLFEETREQVRQQLEERAGVEIPEQILNAVVGSGVMTRQDLILEHQSYSGPIPPGWIKAYDQAVPGFGRQLMDEWREESTLRRETVRHGMKMERREQWHKILLQWTGQVGVLLIVFALLYIGYRLTQDGKDIAGFLSGAAAVLIPVLNALFRPRTTQDDGERVEKPKSNGKGRKNRK